MPEQEQGPWTQYAAPVAKGPWEDYAKPPEPAKEKKTAGQQAADFLSTLGNDIVSIPGAIGGAVLHPIDTVTGIAKNSKESLSKALEALKNGEYSEAHRHATEAVPLLGKFVTGTQDDINAGDYGKAGARITEMVAAPKAIERVPALKAAGKELIKPKPGGRLAKAGEAYSSARAPAPAEAPAGPPPVTTLDPQFQGPIAPVGPIPAPPLGSRVSSTTPAPLVPVEAPPVTSASPQFRGPVVPGGSIAKPGKTRVSNTNPEPEPTVQAPPAVPNVTLDPRTQGPIKRVTLPLAPAPAPKGPPTNSLDPAVRGPAKAVTLPPKPVPAPVGPPTNTSDPRLLTSLKTAAKDAEKSVEAAAPAGRAPRPSDDFYKVHGQVRKSMAAARDLFEQGITAKQLEALSAADRAKALKGHSGETFERILFEMRGLETGKIK